MIAYGRGGVVETLRGREAVQPTGLFFEEQSVKSIIAAVERFEKVGTVHGEERISLDAVRDSPHPTA